MAINPPQGSTRDYLLAFGIAAVYVAAPAAHRPAHIGAARDLARALGKLRMRSPFHLHRDHRRDGAAEGPALQAAYWVRDKERAADLVQQVRGRFADAVTLAGDIDATAAAVIGEIEEAAKVAGLI